MSIVTTRALNRATLARQMLLRRESMDAKTAVEKLAGLQAQVPKPPYLALWSRLENFERDELRKLIARHDVVRATMMRGTIHLMTRKDFLAWRMPLQPVLTDGARLTKNDGPIDVDALVAAARKFFAKGARTFEEVREHLVEHFPGGNDRLMGYAVRMHLPLVLVPDDSAWSYPSNSAFAEAESFLGKKLVASTKLQDLILRYLAAFGPATPADFQAWSGLRGIRPVFEELRPQLEVLRDDRKRELFDLPAAPRPAEDTDAPVRFLPDYDNATLGYADKSRIVPVEYQPRLATKNLRVLAVFLVDGFVAGTWSIQRKTKSASITIEPFPKLTAKVRKSLEQEGERLLRFVEEDAASFTVAFA